MTRKSPRRAARKPAKKIARKVAKQPPSLPAAQDRREDERKLLREAQARRRAEQAAIAKVQSRRRREFQAWLKRESSPARRLGMMEATATAAPPFAILAEGDSWFDYPQILGTGGGAITHLQRQLSADKVRCRIYNLAHHSHTVQGMLGVEQRLVLRDELAAAVRSGRPFRALLFSGGGNDIAGDQFLFWIKRRNEASSVADAIDAAPFLAIQEVIRKGYRDLIRLRDEESPRTIIIANAYDYPRIFGTGVCGIGPWLEPSLKYRGWSPAEYFEVVRHCLARFAGMLQGLAADPQNRLVVAQTQGALTRSDQWHNELHPSGTGFTIVAQRLRAALRSAFPGEPL